MKAPFLFLISASLVVFSCKKDEPEPPTPPPTNPPAATLVYSVEGEMNGTPFNWVVDGVNYKQNLAPYHTINVSSTNNFLRYGTSIGAENVNQIPYFMIEFSGFQGNSNDLINSSNFLSYFHLGNHDFVTAANQDTAIGINLIYEMDLNYTNIHQSANLTQLPSTYFIIDSVTPVVTTVNNTDAYLKVRFEATLNDPDKPGQDVVITNGVMRLLVDNFYEE